MGALGERFRQARLDRHATLQDAQRETRIHRRFLDALENEDVAALPAPVYTRGFIRTYAEFLGIAPEPMVDLYQTMRGSDEPTEIHSATTRINNPKPVSTRLLGIVTGGILVILLLVTSGANTIHLWKVFGRRMLPRHLDLHLPVLQVLCHHR